VKQIPLNLKWLLVSLIFLVPFLATAEANVRGEFRLENDVYKILTLEEWENASKTGFVVTELDKKNGFIHLSTSSQLAAILSLFFTQHEKLVLLQLKQEESKDLVKILYSNTNSYTF
jgi:hypothetical protein